MKEKEKIEREDYFIFIFNFIETYLGVCHQQQNCDIFVHRRQSGNQAIDIGDENGKTTSKM